MSPAADPADRLERRLTQARAQVATLQRVVDDIRDSRRLTFTDDEHDPEGSTVSLDQVRDSALLARAQVTLRELEAARQRLAEGTYGRCECCGATIPAQRLEARPEARVCVPCATGPARRRASA